MSREARWPPEVLRAAGGVRVEVGTAGHVWQIEAITRKTKCRQINRFQRFISSFPSFGRARREIFACVLCKVIKADVDQGLGISRISHSPAAEISTSLFSKKSS
jgi:hypothetical protein